MRALDGITVVSLEHAIAAPFASRHLADQGARVIKIERPDGGDFARSYDVRVKGEASHFVWVNRSKESVCLDLKSQHGKETLLKLLRRADVFIQNLGPGVTDSLGFDAISVHQVNPRCITCSISGYGQGGPLDQRKAYDLLIQAESGLLSITGTPDSTCKVGISIADIAAGMYAYTNILNALILREKEGVARSIEISMLEALTEWMGFPLYYCVDNQSPPPRTGSSHATIFPYGPYRTKGGETLVIAIQHQREWTRFCCEVLKDERLAEDIAFITNYGRSAARETLQPLIERSLLEMSVEDAILRLDEAGIAFSQLNSVPELWDHKQLAARGRFVEVDSTVGPIPALLPPGLDQNSAYMGAVPTLGQDTQAVLEWLEEEPRA